MKAFYFTCTEAKLICRALAEEATRSEQESERIASSLTFKERERNRWEVQRLRELSREFEAVGFHGVGAIDEFGGGVQS